MLKRRIQPSRTCKRTRSQDEKPKVREKAYSELPFPNEIMAMILQYLPLGDLGVLLRTSRALRFMALDARFLVRAFKRATMDDFIRIGSSRLNEMIFARVFPVIGKLSVRVFVLLDLFYEGFYKESASKFKLFAITRSLVQSSVTVGNQCFGDMIEIVIKSGVLGSSPVGCVPYLVNIYGTEKFASYPLKYLVFWMIDITQNHDTFFTGAHRSAWPVDEYRKTIDIMLSDDSVLLDVLQEIKKHCESGYTYAAKKHLEYLTNISKANVRRFPRELNACFAAYSETIHRDLVDR